MIAGPSEQGDDWLLQSMRRYESLYMFELPQPTRCIEWSQNGTAICVAGFSTETSCEITQLALPGKLLLAQDETHWAKRDFRLINGAISSFPITALRHLPNANALATSGGQPSITLWTSDQQNTDCLKESTRLSLSLPQSIANGVPRTDSHTFIDSPRDSATTILTAMSLSLSTVQELDLATGRCVFSIAAADLERRLHGLLYIATATNMIVSCSGGEGGVDIWDTRLNGGRTDSSAATLDECSVTGLAVPLFGFAISSEPHPLTKVATLNAASGKVQLYDVRQHQTPCASCKLEGADDVQRWFKKTIRTPCIQFSDTEPSLVSVSGCTRGVSVYDSSKWAENMVTPVFTHVGHEEDSPTAQVLTHCWQPSSKSTVLSTDSDGSLHAWQWKNF